MNRMEPPHQRPAELDAPGTPFTMLSARPDLRFEPGNGAPMRDRVTGNLLRVDGYWNDSQGRTVFVALSNPGTILRRPAQLYVDPSS